jgi:signal transduction histidine kinase
MLVDLTARDTAEQQLVLELRERVKELRLLHAAARLLQLHRRFEPEVLDHLVELIPPAWLHADCCAARITYREIEVHTPGFRASPWLQSESFATRAGRGCVEVAYLAERPTAAEGPFLAEERALLRSLVEMLVAYLEHHEAETQRRELEHQLRQAQKMEALGTLAGGIAHDFNNILMAIGFNVELLLADHPEQSRARSSLEQVLQAYDRAVDLVKRILLFSRNEESVRKVLPLEPLVEEILALLRSSLPLVRVTATYEPDLPKVFADASQLHQVLMNLGTNAAHAMANGGLLTVAVSRVCIDDLAAAPSVDLTLGTYVCITVSDTGSGMSPEVLERIFEPFFTTKGRKGTGLGLSVVHGIVRDHQGAIAVSSELGVGTSFSIYLPEAETSAELTKSEPNAPPRGHGERILCVDDEEALVLVMERVLGRLGYACTGFTEASSALHAFRADPRAFDLVITDGAMPHTTGLQFARELRAIRPDVPIVLSSAHAETSEAAAELGIALRIAKPARVAELARALRTALEHSS